MCQIPFCGHFLQYLLSGCMHACKTYLFICCCFMLVSNCSVTLHMHHHHMVPVFACIIWAAACNYNPNFSCCIFLWSYFYRRRHSLEKILHGMVCSTSLLKKKRADTSWPSPMVCSLLTCNVSLHIICFSESLSCAEQNVVKILGRYWIMVIAKYV